MNFPEFLEAQTKLDSLNINWQNEFNKRNNEYNDIELSATIQEKQIKKPTSSETILDV